MIFAANGLVTILMPQTTWGLQTKGALSVVPNPPRVESLRFSFHSAWKRVTHLRYLVHSQR